jgi:D-sedoheptulose 7-phosphate isomerase
MPSLKEYFGLCRNGIASVDTFSVAEAINWLQEARALGRMVFVAGNGGSAATASHFVCDMAKGASYGHAARFRIMALNDNVPTLTAYSNDVSYEAAFVETLKNFAGPGDVFIAISASGNSPNVVRATEYANLAGCRTIGLTGRDGGRLAKLAQLNIHVTSKHMGCIEDAHMIVCHAIAYSFIDEELPATAQSASAQAVGVS